MKNLQSRRALYCLHPIVNERGLLGNYKTGEDYRDIGVQVLSCASKVVYFDGTEIDNYDNCNWNQTEVFDYMKNVHKTNSFRLVSFYNDVTFLSQKYGKERIRRQLASNQV